MTMIQEEYANRHKMPLVLDSHTLKEANAYLRSTDTRGMSHLIMTVRWTPHDRHPGSYQVFCQKPVHDSHTGRGNFGLIQEPNTIGYEEFGHSIHKYRALMLPSFRAVTDPKELSLFAWEMFVCCYDGWIVRNATPKLMSFIEASLDPGLPIDARHENYEASVSTIGYENTGVFERWQVYFANPRKKVLPWLGRLFNGD